MRVIRKICFLSLLVVATLSIQNVSAVLTSSYHDGFVRYDEGGLRGRIDYAVYDTLHPEYGDEYLANGIEIPGTGQYIYAYQIFNDPFVSDEVAHFAILDIDGDAINEALMNATSAQNIGTGGIAPDPTVSITQGVWKWTFDGGYISEGEHSWFLVFSSAQDWVRGSYEIKSHGVPVPIPEPGMLTLLGIGGALAFIRRRKSAR